MNRFFSLLFFVVLASNLLDAQQAVHSDSLRQKLQTDSLRIYRKTSARLFLKLENRYSPIASERVNMLGVMGGVTLHEHHSFFLGYFLMLPEQVAPFVVKLPGLSGNAQSFLDMRYGHIGYQYVLYRRRYFQMNMPFTAGLGTCEVLLQKPGSIEPEQYGGSILPLSAGLQLIVKPLSWLGLSASGGYRYVLQQKNVDLSLHGAYYSFGIWMDGRFVSRHLRYKNKVRIHQRALKDAKNGA